MGTQIGMKQFLMMAFLDSKKKKEYLMHGREGGHGLTDLKKALVESSNPFFMNLSIRYEKNLFVDFLKKVQFFLREDIFSDYFLRMFLYYQ